MCAGLREERNDDDLFGMLLDALLKGFTKKRRGMLQIGFFNDPASTLVTDLGYETPSCLSGTLRPAHMKQKPQSSRKLQLHRRLLYLSQPLEKVNAIVAKIRHADFYID
jgi:hypothetical protein